MHDDPEPKSVELGLIDNSGKVIDLQRVSVGWQSESLTIATVIWAGIVTVAGVIVAMNRSSALWQAIYAVGSFGLLLLLRSQGVRQSRVWRWFVASS